MKDALAAVGLTGDPELTPGMPAPPERASDAGIAVGEIEAGIAALRFDPILLSADPRVRRTRLAQASHFCVFLCLEVDGDESTWTVLTRSGGNERRLQIEPEWRTGGNYGWRNGRLFLANGASLWRGPLAAFASAAWRDSLNNPAQRARLTPPGLQAVYSQVEAGKPEW